MARRLTTISNTQNGVFGQYFQPQARVVASVGAGVASLLSLLNAGAVIGVVKKTNGDFEIYSDDGSFTHGASSDVELTSQLPNGNTKSYKWEELAGPDGTPLGGGTFATDPATGQDAMSLATLLDKAFDNTFEPDANWPDYAGVQMECVIDQAAGRIYFGGVMNTLNVYDGTLEATLSPGNDLWE